MFETAQTLCFVQHSASCLALLYLKASFSSSFRHEAADQPCAITAHRCHVMVRQLCWLVQANMDMSVEVLETALEHARKENAELKRRLEMALGVASASSRVCTLFHAAWQMQFLSE